MLSKPFKNCLPESAHKNDNGDCEDDWEAAYVTGQNFVHLR
jgi:hypothetical protein